MIQNMILSHKKEKELNVSTAEKDKNSRTFRPEKY